MNNELETKSDLVKQIEEITKDVPFDSVEKVRKVFQKTISQEEKENIETKERWHEYFKHCMCGSIWVFMLNWW